MNNGYAQLASTTTVNNVGNYGHKKIPGIEVTLNVKAGEKYQVIGNATLNPGILTEVYLQTRVNDVLIGGAATLRSSVQSWDSITKVAQYTATADGSVTFSLYVSTGDPNASASIQVFTGSSLSVMRMA